MRESRRFLFVWWEGGGNMPPALDLVRRLTARGHRVHVLGDPSSEQAFRAKGAGFWRFERAPNRIDLKPENDPMRDWEAANPLQALGILRDRLLFGPARALAEDTLAQIYRFRPDAMAIMDGTYGAMLAAERIGIPAAVIAPNILPYPVPGRPPFGPGLAPARNTFERVREGLIRKLIDHVLGKGLDEYNAVRRLFRLDPLRGVYDQVSRMQRILVMTSLALELPGGALPENVRYVGASLGDPAWADPWESPWADDRKEPLVLVSFSTTFQNQSGALRRVIEGLGTLPVRALVTVGPALRTETFRAPSNVVLRESAPHSRILPHAAVMITHGGHGSVVRALAHGVPLVCMPMGRDQNDMAARVVHHGVGLRLATTASAERITQAVEQVIGRPEFRVHAEHMGQTIRRDAATSRAIPELETLAGCWTRPDPPYAYAKNFDSTVTA